MNVPETVSGEGVPLGISEDGTAEIGAGAGLPVAGLCVWNLDEGGRERREEREDPHGQKVRV